MSFTDIFINFFFILRDNLMNLKTRWVTFFEINIHAEIFEHGLHVSSELCGERDVSHLQNL